MPTVEERLTHVTLKLKRAKKHVADLDRELRAFLDANPYKVGAKHDPQTRKLIYYVTSVDPIPECVPFDRWRRHPKPDEYPRPSRLPNCV
jgi:hypothetical protein